MCPSTISNFQNVNVELEEERRKKKEEGEMLTSPGTESACKIHHCYSHHLASEPHCSTV